MKQLFFLMLLPLVYVVSCADLERDNLLDPLNPQSFTERAILVEMFVNDSTGYDYCEYAVEAMEEISLREENEGKIITLEYHVTKSGWNDPLSLNETNQRYHEYIPSTNERGIPDAFFNGTGLRVQGASEENIYNRYAAAVDQLLGDTGYFLIEAEKKIAGNVINLDVTIARLGNSDKSDLSVNAVVYENRGTSGQRFLVKKILPRQIISRFDSGQVKNFSFSAAMSANDTMERMKVVVFLQDQNSSGREIYQVAQF
ncbi:MAG: hypothetical protein ACOY90_18145 [Candidatus Zhuqueibacterota bacterium]